MISEPHGSSIELPAVTRPWLLRLLFRIARRHQQLQAVPIRASGILNYGLLTVSVATVILVQRNGEV